ncbi:MAG: YjcQ family protein [Fusobacterium sp. JB019]|nr:YjcQ family protein [Fusobacterium sp. JB019]
MVSNYMKTVYRILKIIDLSRDKEDFNFDKEFDLEKLEIDEKRFEDILETLNENGYIKGIKISRSINGASTISISSPRLTLDGMEYLEENTVMKNVYKALKEAKEWIPGL